MTIRPDSVQAAAEAVVAALKPGIDADLIDRISRDVAQRTPSRDRLLVNGLAVACESLTLEEYRTQLATVDDLTVVCWTALHEGRASKLKRPGGLTHHGAPDDRAREAKL